MNMLAWIPPIIVSKLVRSKVPNLAGDRDIEWSWVAGNIPDGNGNALDFGYGSSSLPLVLALKGYHTMAIDLEKHQQNYFAPNITFIRGDILAVDLPRNYYDVVVNCSTVEHVGLAGRYGVKEDNLDGDLQAMVRLGDLMKPQGIMLLTIPVGQDAVFKPLCRVYGNARTPELLKGYIVDGQEYWVKDTYNRWVLVSKEIALNYKASAGSWNPLRNIYALGCFVLRKP